MRDLISHTARMSAASAPRRPPRGDYARLRPRRTVAFLAVALVPALAVITGGCGNSGTSSAAPHGSSSSGAIHFPATLFGLRQDTGSGGQHVTHAFIHELSIMPIFTHPQAAVYGTPAGPFFLVGISGLTAAAKKYGNTKPAAMRRGLLAMGVTNARLFPAHGGGKPACGKITRGGASGFICLRYDKKAVGMAFFINGAASSLIDAAAKTNLALNASGG